MGRQQSRQSAATPGPGVLRVGGQQSQREQAEGGRSSAQRLLEQADRQQEVGRALAQESVGAYMDFLDATFSQYRAGAMASEQTAAGVLGAVTGATGRTRDAAAEGAQGPRRRPPSR